MSKKKFESILTEYKGATFCVVYDIKKNNKNIGEYIDLNKIIE